MCNYIQWSSVLLQQNYIQHSIYSTGTNQLYTAGCAPIMYSAKLWSTLNFCMSNVGNVYGSTLQVEAIGHQVVAML